MSPSPEHVMDPSPLRVGSMFSGVGGLDRGLELAGMRVVWQAETDPACCAVLAHHWPDVPNLGDVELLDGRRVPVAIDVLAGGFPCQDVSQAGARAGFGGERSSLFHEFTRVAAETAARWVVIENVPGLLTSNEGQDFLTVLESLADIGYEDISWRVVDACGLRPAPGRPGVPQRRRRLLVVGHLAPAGTRTAQVLLEPQGRPWRAAQGQPPGADAAAGPAGRSDRGGAALDRPRGADRAGRHHRAVQHGGWVSDGVASPVRARDFKGGTVDLVTYRKVHRAASATDAETWEESGIAPTLNTFDGWTEVRATALVVSPPEPIVRRLTPVECERLQGLPDDWTAPAVTETARYRGIGNAVAVPMAEWIGRRIIAAEETP